MEMLAAFLLFLLFPVLPVLWMIRVIAAGNRSTVWTQSPEKIKLASEMFDLAGHDWERVRRASTYKDGVHHVDRLKLIELTRRETGTIDLVKEAEKK